MKSSLWYVKNMKREFIAEADIEAAAHGNYRMANVVIEALPNILGVNELVISESDGLVIKKINKVSYSNYKGEREITFQVAPCKK